ncbi:conserved hypothetical protein [Flavobacterium sp. 9R]|uniref:hypothetical protein n=1 Tax=Flavobacterium sp. 9R TaxID=2653143 RepID=UPI0012F0A4ED|nr:hypothetical protein [Flavobacterium sp. 9R]VXB39457.1 conserved hypothetical protein [Flavobacterium sp. 9R]
MKINSKLFQKTLKYELITLKNNNTLYSYLIEAFSNTNGDLYPGTIKKLNNYSGTLNIFNLDGTLLGQLVINKGKILNPSNEKKIEPLENVIQLFYKPNKNSTTNKIPECNAFFVVKLITEYYVDRYEIWKYASTGEVFLTKYIGQVLVKTEVTYKNMAVAYPCDSEYGNDDIHIPYLSKNYQTVFKENADILEEKIDYSQLDPCTKAIMEKLKNSNEKDIASIFKKFGATTIYKLTMMMGAMQKVDSFAETIKTSTNNYLITVSKDNYTTASDLYRATALLHEIIHAYMLSIVDDSNYPTTTTPQLTNFPELFKAFVNKRNNTQAAVMAQHEDMAKIYVEAIATALEQFQWNETGGIPSTLADKQIFLDMAWSGLHKTAVFDKTYPIGNPNRDRILARILAEQNGVYSQGQYAIGKKCN